MSSNSSGATSTSEDALRKRKENVQGGDGAGGSENAAGDDAAGERPPKRPRLEADDGRGSRLTVSPISSSSAVGIDSGGGGSSNGNSNDKNDDDDGGKRQRQRFPEPDSAALRDMACGNCIFCRMPRCERCFLCVSQDASHEGCCLRKTCIAIPIELKLRSATPLGSSGEGWRFAFDDPQKATLVASARRAVPAGLAGLRIVSPGGTVHHSLESAFPHIPWRREGDSSQRSSEEAAADVVAKALEEFLVHVGSSRYVSVPHFLVGKEYCIEFTAENGSNVVLFGNVVACMSPPPSSSPESSNGRSNACSHEDDTKVFFIVRYDASALLIAEKGAGTSIRQFHLLSSELAWGGCISYERKTCCRRDTRSAIQNIDQATAVETWIAPDMRLEEAAVASEDGDGTSLPLLTMFARGYEFLLRVKVIPDDRGDGKRQLGVFARCRSLRGEGGASQELNLKPGELIDLGTVAPANDDETKTLAAFIVKNYVHKFKVGRWGVASGLDDEVRDPTDDGTGRLSDAASGRILPYARRCRNGGGGDERRRVPMAHARIAPDGRVHLLFGIRYEGNWGEYEAGMRELVPLFG
eukprot:CAMPEP_0172543972 /NCGR_PEP_ID=MMETSP1067-20121228/14231_1 /TAXON_ID=265564 ORGANISM="Thalassiosira punctigera, Strain Tpunct2005C2" /NCGR_SAMPLE_ID=MMETSP1067 /ASSEMBLY_ACC=CAM_ASM_000444 /LENGTH=581 /DNA_ID=CAMNT_0013330465 /DNA_START=78 /DNA_END=1820 /DNA_ORIENTATION=-